MILIGDFLKPSLAQSSDIFLLVSTEFCEHFEDVVVKSQLGMCLFSRIVQLRFYVAPSIAKTYCQALIDINLILSLSLVHFEFSQSIGLRILERLDNHVSMV